MIEQQASPAGGIDITLHTELLMVSLHDKMPALEISSIVPLRDLHGKGSHCRQ